jgi:hypothetical protein
MRGPTIRPERLKEWDCCGLNGNSAGHWRLEVLSAERLQAAGGEEATVKSLP